MINLEHAREQTTQRREEISDGGDPRTKWVSRCRKYAIVSNVDIPPGSLRSLAGGLNDLIHAYFDDGMPRHSDESKIVPWNSIGRAPASLMSVVRRLDMPWEVSDYKVVISDYPKVCGLCGCWAYLGLSEVVHDPQQDSLSCPGRVFE